MKKTGDNRSDHALLLVLCLAFLLFPLMFYAFMTFDTIEAFALDSAGRLYIGQRPTIGSSIRVFDGSEMLYSFRNVTERGYKMTIQNDELLIYTGSALYHLDLNGNVLEKQTAHPETSGWGKAFTDSEGNTYYLKTLGRDRIIKNGREVFFQQSQHDWIVTLFLALSFPVEFILILLLLALTGMLKPGFASTRKKI